MFERRIVKAGRACSLTSVMALADTAECRSCPHVLPAGRRMGWPSLGGSGEARSGLNREQHCFPDLRTRGRRSRPGGVHQMSSTPMTRRQLRAPAWSSGRGRTSTARGSFSLSIGDPKVGIASCSRSNAAPLPRRGVFSPRTEAPLPSCGVSRPHLRGDSAAERDCQKRGPAMAGGAGSGSGSGRPGLVRRTEIIQACANSNADPH